MSVAYLPRPCLQAPLGEAADTFTVAQMLIDYDEQNDREAIFSVSLP
jgi:hypothetical protein